jgi:hypothetical protein
MADLHSESAVEGISFNKPRLYSKMYGSPIGDGLGSTGTTKIIPNKPKTWAIIHFMVANKKKVLVDAEYNAIALSRRHKRGAAM